MGVESILCIALCGSFLEYSQRNSQLHCEQFANEKACDPDGLISVARLGASSITGDPTGNAPDYAQARSGVSFEASEFSKYFNHLVVY
ncbi:pre-mRNA splicing factor Syf-1 [Aspergillus luchuensis]|uniref:Pre-mRNA splicing factor Syf-1 n=1 Tax=Aspergillus kawachii TaxID=1069201 RepID=A0A146G1K0_ASPKA|nr:pre-mRNA splicing factor Syf-1 [Aspergillus luchuensis]